MSDLIKTQINNIEVIQNIINNTKSFLRYQWILDIPQSDNEEILLAIAKKRNIDVDADNKALLIEYLDNGLHKIPNIQKAIELLNSFDKFAIVGDYDADGITSTAQLVMMATLLNKEAIPFLPNRFIDGYGLSDNIVENIIQSNIKLVITVDNGTTAYEQIKNLSESGVKTIVIDHHVLQDTIVIDAFVNPFITKEKNEYQELSASGLVLVFIYHILKNKDKMEYFEKFASIASIGTICDMVPLNTLNRVLVAYGIEALNSKPAAWMVDLLNGREINEKRIGNIIGALLNVAGRFGATHLALQLLLSDADSYKSKLNDLQFKIHQRRLIEEAIRYDICGDKQGSKIKKPMPTVWNEKWPLLVDCGDIIICAHTNWHEGVLGIIAGNMKDLFNKTAIILTKQHNSREYGYFKGSIRSVPGLHVGNMIHELKKRNLIIQGGGHEMAGGLVIENLYSLYKFCIEYEKQIENERQLIIEGICSLSIINNKTSNIIRKLSPFGIKNNEILFLFPNCIITRIYQNTVKNYTVFFISHPNIPISIYSYVLNKTLESFMTVNRNKLFLIVGTIVQYNHKPNPQLHIYDIRVIESLNSNTNTDITNIV